MASLNEKKMLQLLLEELQGKKAFQPYSPTECHFCGDDIEPGDDFYFVEGKRKLCSDCLTEIMEYLEVKISEL